LLATLPLSAQRRERGYIALTGGAQMSTGTLTDRFIYTVNVEDATTDARYPSKAGVMFDGGAGMRFWRNVGAAIHVSHSAAGRTARTDSLIPHPFFDDRDRQVSGDATDITRTETAAHVQLYYVRDFGRWRVRLGAGPSYFSVAQDVVTGVTVDEEFPYDIATFRNATTGRARDFAPGLNAGADIGWMFTRCFGASALVRFARGKVDFNVDGTHRVSTDAGGAQAGAGIRVSF
jgi:hypothetical protein